MWVGESVFDGDGNGPSAVGGMSVVFGGRIITLFPSVQAFLTQVAANVVGAVFGGVVEETGVGELYQSKKEQIFKYKVTHIQQQGRDRDEAI